METYYSLKNLIIVVALATAFSSFTLWVIDSWIKYPLFLFEVLIIAVLYLFFNPYNDKIFTQQNGPGTNKIGITIDLFLLVSAFEYATSSLVTSRFAL